MSGHWPAWRAARVEVEQQAQATDAHENPVEQKIVEALVAETRVNRTT